MPRLPARPSVEDLDSRAGAQLLDGGRAAPAQLQADLLAGESAPFFFAQHHCGGASARLREKATLWIVACLQPLSSARICLAGQQEIREALRTAQRVAGLERAQNRVG